MKRKTAKDVMTTPVIAVRTSDTVGRVARTLLRHRISGVPVLDDFGLMVGIVSEGDLLARRADRFTAEDVMTPTVFTADEGTPVTEVARRMVRHQINRIPIVRGEELVGIVTRADVLNEHAETSERDAEVVVAVGRLEVVTV